MPLSQDTNVLAYLRKESLDIYNRLHSINEDVHFVQLVHETYPKIPLLRMFCIIECRKRLTTAIANLRCGAWYTSPDIVRIFDIPRGISPI